MKSIFEETTYNELLERLNRLERATLPQWGKMNIAQMLTHCQAPLKVGLGKSTLPAVSPLKRLLFKSFKASLYNDKPWKRNLRTTKEYEITDERDFSVEKNTLRELIEEFYKNKDREQWPVHPFFGTFTPEQWGKLQYKHLDHHFRQFKV